MVKYESWHPGACSLLTMNIILYFAHLLLCLPVAFAAFGVTTSGSNMVVDSGAGLVTTSEWLEIVMHLDARLMSWNSTHNKWGHHFYSFQWKTAARFLQIHAAQLGSW